jgi:hypothetical protein
MSGSGLPQRKLIAEPHFAPPPAGYGPFHCHQSEPQREGQKQFTKSQDDVSFEVEV